MRFLSLVVFVLFGFAAPAFAESNDLINNFARYKFEQKQLKYENYKNSSGTFSNFSSDTFVGVPKTGRGYLYDSGRNTVPGENTFGRSAPSNQGGLKIQF